jgi:hypothetical protein
VKGQKQYHQENKAIATTQRVSHIPADIAKTAQNCPEEP